MAFKMNRRMAEDTDIDITSFMNLMIVLVPVLLLSLTFTKVRVLDINLPELSGGQSAAELSQSQLDVMVDSEGFAVYFPTGKLLKKIPLKENQYDYRELSQLMRDLKNQLSDKKDATIIAAKNVEYQTLISTMDTIKSYKTVLAASLVEVELFPEISLGDKKR
ncbi:MAG: biopolymer transporter ExbD [Thalassobium sp.]|jgi:biopolymer transport protein ExbD|uniref:Biopolymer transporter ExbD n=1 Tax=Thalassolituus pacificus TaxID=2975440 RepID=A0A9X3AQG4_9GAMM|nr:biopolymer transporter ExbD [Thalassolituus pacificus]MCT7357784.1 biopolymer transporter ExbD [Thalassolituus pacificus]PHS61406.1 MAG: biopolymer transporter ExbD [Thalassobium sp.]